MWPKKKRKAWNIVHTDHTDPQSIRLISASPIRWRIDSLALLPGKTLRCGRQNRHSLIYFPAEHHFTSHLGHYVHTDDDTRPEIGQNNNSSVIFKSWPRTDALLKSHWRPCFSLSCKSVTHTHTQMERECAAVIVQHTRSWNVQNLLLCLERKVFL